MSSITLEFERKAGEHGTLFGSVTSMDIAEALQAKGYEIDRRKIVLKDAIKETGEYTVNVKLHREVILAVPVIVTAEGGEVSRQNPNERQRKKQSPRLRKLRQRHPSKKWSPKKLPQHSKNRQPKRKYLLQPKKRPRNKSKK